MAAKLFILAGVPGCGKSTWARRVLGGVHMSSDEIRQDLFGDKYDAKQNAEVFARFYKEIDKFLLTGMHVIADATNLNNFARSELRTIADRVGCETHLFFFTNVEQALLRNAERDGEQHGSKRVPNEGMTHMLEKYELARRDVPLEPYNSVTYIGSVS
jgi:predicted kinase